MNQYALIVAGGRGLRMGLELPKQFMELNGLPVLMHTLQAFHAIENISIVLVLPEDQFVFWKQLCAKHNFKIPHQLVLGGHTRFESVRNGLQVISDRESLVAIHDGVRPLISSKVINECFKVAEIKGNSVAVVALKDSIRKQELIGNHSVNRANYYLVQTPQTFNCGLIQDAYAKATHDNFTDDASVLEEAGGEINMVAGSYKNIKITTPEDMLIANAFLAVN